MFKLTYRFPLQVALGALALYILTFSHGVTLNSLALTAQIAGWNDAPLIGQPLFWLLTLPLRLLPDGWVPAGLNLFSAATAALTLGILTRTVQLLPWDNPWTKENRLVAVLPVGLAVIGCGLEFSFWQDATAATGEMLDLLLLATALWLLLEYRLNQDFRWFNAAAFVWGLGMTENWLMLLALPFFIAGVVWLRGRMFFRVKFILRLAGLGLAGFSIYALLPMVNGLATHSEWSLGHAWVASLRQTKNVVLVLYYQFWHAHRLLTAVVVIYFLVPILPCLVRLRDEGTKNKGQVDRFQTWLYRGFRGLLLAVCVWLVFDPIAGPRQILHSQFGVSLPLLTFDYLNALGAAFLAGNLLLIAQTESLRRRKRSATGITWQKLIIPCNCGLLVLIGAGLMVRNASAIWHLNSHPLQDFGELAVQSLPAGRGVMLSDQLQKLAAFQAALSHRRNATDWLAVDTVSLPAVAYREKLERCQPDGWLTNENHHKLTSVETLQLLEQIARTNRLFCLQPSYGFFFERFYLEPNGAIYEMKLRGNKPLEIPSLTKAETRANETFWSNAWKQELVLFLPTPSQRPTFLQKKIKKLGLTTAPRYQDQLLAEWYSLALDAWGVALQKQGQWQAAQTRLDQALQLNPNNFSAKFSLSANTNLQTGHKFSLAEVGRADKQLGSLQRLSLLMDNDGPFDDPILCYLLGCVYQKTGLLLQAVEQFERTRMFAPDVPGPEFVLAGLYTQLQLTDRAQPLINRLKKQTKLFPDGSNMDVELALLEANSWFSQTNLTNARSTLKSILQQHPNDTQVMRRVMSTYVAFGDFTNALRLVEMQLAEAPDDMTNLQDQAAILIQSGHAAIAIPVLNHLLTLTNLPAARFSRAAACFAVGDFAGAEADYLELEKEGIRPDMVYYGLAALAHHSHATNQEAHYLRLYITNAPPNSLVWHEASVQLQKLEIVARPK